MEEHNKLHKFKPDISTKYVKSKSCSPFRVISLYGGEKKCVKIDDAFLILEAFKALKTLHFFKETKDFIKDSERLIAKTDQLLDSFSTYCPLVGEAETPVSELADVDPPVFCITDVVLGNAMELAGRQRELLLMRKYWRDLPDGGEALLNCECGFEDLAKTLKIGRRTWLITSDKKAKLKKTKNIRKERPVPSLYNTPLT